MKRQFLIDMVLFWIVYTKEGKKTINSLVNTFLKKNKKDDKEYKQDSQEKSKITMDDN